MRNKILIAIVGAITLLGIGFMVYDSLYPEVPADLVYEEDEYIVYFLVDGCPYCEEIENDVQNYIDADNEVPLHKRNFSLPENQGKWDDWDVKGTPTMIYVKDGIIRDKAVGPGRCRDLLEKYSD